MICKRDLCCLKRCLAACLLALMSACSSGPDDLSQIDRAKLALSNGDAVLAEVTLREMLADGAAESEVSAYLGEAELQQGQLAEAREWLGAGEFNAASSSHGFHMLGRLEMREGNLPAAGQAFDRSLQADPDNAQLWVDIGRLRYLGGEQSQAVEASAKAVEIEPTNPAALQFRAQLLRDSQGLQAALPWFERALEQNPENVELLLEYGATLGELGRAKDALTVIRRVAKIAPQNRKIYFLQAVIAARGDKFQLARSLLLRTGSSMEEVPAAMLLSGIIDLENGNYSSAAQTLERLAAKQPDNRRVRNLLARALFMGRNDREVVYRFADNAKSVEGTPYLKTLVARSYEALEERDKASPLLDEAAMPLRKSLVALKGGATSDVAEARGSNSGSDALTLTRARVARKNGNAAVSAAQSFLEKFPGSADALVLAADANVAARRYSRAERLYGDATGIRSPWPVVRKQHRVLLAMKRKEAALSLLSRYFVGDPGNAEVAALLAEAAAEREDWEAAAVFADHAVVNGGSRDPALLARQAQIELQLGEIETALDIAKRAYAIQPSNRAATEALADSYAASEDGKPAAAVLRRKLTLLKN